MFPRRAYQLTFVVFELSAAAGVTLDLITGTADIGTATVATGAVTVIYGVVVTLRDPDRARLPSD